MHKLNRELIVPRITIILIFLTSSLRVFSIISPHQAIFLLIIIILLAVILSSYQSKLKRREKENLD